MLCVERLASVLLASVCLLLAVACTGGLVGHLSYAAQPSEPLNHYALVGNVDPVLDPSIVRQGSTYYAFNTDVVGFQETGSLPIRCSQDKVNWSRCGSVFPDGVPAWISNKVPGSLGLWAPDISYFNGLYHVYYCASILGTNDTVIGLATNTTLDVDDAAYRWVDRGLVLESRPGDDFNALDPNILVDSDGKVWLTYGSYWSGIKQQQVNAQTGMLLGAHAPRYDLATRPGVAQNPIEGASLVKHGGYYYLFVSVDYCCAASLAQDDYKEAVGRSTSPHGPFVDEVGTAMMEGGGTVLLEGNSRWNAPGGGTAYVDSGSGESLLIFHAQNLSKGGIPFVWIKTLDWVNGWPSLGN